MNRARKQSERSLDSLEKVLRSLGDLLVATIFDDCADNGLNGVQISMNVFDDGYVGYTISEFDEKVFHEIRRATKLHKGSEWKSLEFVLADHEEANAE